MPPRKTEQPNISIYSIYSIFGSFVRVWSASRRYIRTIRRDIGSEANSMTETLRLLLNVGNLEGKEKDEGKGKDKTSLIAGMFAGKKGQPAQRVR